MSGTTPLYCYVCDKTRVPAWWTNFDECGLIGRQRRSENFHGSEFWARPTRSKFIETHYVLRETITIDDAIQSFMLSYDKHPPRYDYDRFDEIDWLIMIRDNHICAICNRDREVHLMVHHKDGNKRNHHPENLITLCKSCHGTIHGKIGLLSIEEGKKVFKNKHAQ